MTWFDSIYDLQYYNQPKDVPCFCEAVAFPSDMYLQGQLPTGGGNYGLKLFIYSADGLTQYEEATSYFDYYFGKMPNGQHFFNARLKSFSPAMCVHECYIIRAEVYDYGTATARLLFNKYTERYCQNNCCDTARGITFSQDGFVTTGEATTDPILNGGPIDVGIPSEPAANLPAGMCGEPLIRIISKFECIDEFTGEFFELPKVTFNGTTATFPYRKITTLRGRIVRRPREIKREISYNCKLQRTESAAQYLLEGFEYLPPWKMYEIEGQLHANSIVVDDFKTQRAFSFSGGTVMKQINNCFELFKLEAVLEDCTQRQVFGCKEDCNTSTNPDGSLLMFAIPGSYNGGGFYDENRDKIANDYDGLIDYLRTRDGVTDVQDVNISTVDCNIYKAVSINGEGRLTKSFYYDSADANRRVFGKQVNDIAELCNYVPEICTKPVAGVYAVEEAVCIIPEVGMFTVELETSDIVNVYGYGNWEPVDAGTYGSIANGQVLFSIHVTNSFVVSGSDDNEIYLPGVIIGNIGSNGRPAQHVVLTENNNANIPADVTIYIDEGGKIHYTGPAPSTDTLTTIDIDNLVYNI